MLKILLTLLWRFVLISAWVVVLGAFGLFAVEESGILAEVVRRGLAWRMGSLGEELTVERVTLRWFQPGVVLEGVSLRSPSTPNDPGEELLRLRSVHFALHADWERSMPLRRLRIDGGRIRISDPLLRGMNRLATSLRDESDEGSSPLFSPPPFVVTNFEVELELPDASVLEIGTVDLRARPEPEGGYRLFGRLVPSLSGAVRAPVEVRVDGRQWENGIQLEATAVEVPLATSGFRVPAYLGSLPIEEFEGRLTLSVSGQVEFGDSLKPRGSLRVRLEEGRLLPRPDEPWLEGIEADLQAQFHPRPGDELWDRDAWTVASRVHATWGDTPVQVWGEFGKRVPRDAVARIWARAESLPLETKTLRALGAMDTYRHVWEAFSPSGFADATAGLLLRRPDGEDEQGWKSEVCVHVRNTGRSAATFNGFQNLEGERAGIPVPCTNLRGQAVYTLDEDRERPYMLSLVDMEADHGSGPVHAWAVMVAPETAQIEKGPELDFAFDTPEMAVDDVLRNALSKSSFAREIWPTYDPDGGTISSIWRFRRGPETGGLTAYGKVAVNGTSLRWAELPIPLRDAVGELELRWAQDSTYLTDAPELPYRSFGVAYSFRNDAAGAGRRGTSARVRGFAREEGLPGIATLDAIAEQWIQGIDIEIDELLLRGDDWKILTDEFPDLGIEAEELGAKGSMKLRFRGGRARGVDPYVSDAEATPNVVEVRPIFFERRTREIEGRILVRTVSTEERDDVHTRLALAGSWPGGVELAAWADIPPTGPAELRVFGGGIDAENTSFRGALVRVLASEEMGLGADVDLSRSAVRGRLDLSVHAQFEADTEDPPRNTYKIYLRNNTLLHESIQLDELHGVLEQSGDILRSPLVEAELAGHPVELRNVVVFALEDAGLVEDADPVLLRSALLNDPLALALQGQVYTQDLPLDEEHLSSILDEETLQLVRESGTWQGMLDILGAQLLLTAPAESERDGILALRGLMRPHDMALRLGLPIVVSEAGVDVRELVVEDGAVRAWADIQGLQAEMAGRALSNASMILGLVDQRITLDNLSGDFEGGRLESAGSGTGTRKALGIDLAAPHRFDVAVRLSRVQVARLLAGVFSSSVADEGLLDGNLQLSGTTDDILQLTGRGNLSLTEGRLWSIPAARELFNRLGFPNTAVFDYMNTRFELRDGVIDTRYMHVKSSLLHLLGAGTLDLDGRVSYDLDVRYSLLDRLGIFNRLLYLLNNSLWRVAVRGDLERPVVTIRNAFMELFSEFDDRPTRGLPLPEFAELGPRF